MKNCCKTKNVDKDVEKEAACCASDDATCCDTTNGDNHDARIEELTNTIKRVQADYENYRKRVERDNAELRKYAAKEFVSKLLPVLDSFELALPHMDKKDEYIKGIEMIYGQLCSIIASVGVRAIECEGKMFDPAFHEALLSEAHKNKEGTILEVLQKGYTMHDTVIRPAKVKIAKNA